MLGQFAVASADRLSPGLTVGMRYDSPTAGSTTGLWTGTLTPQLILERLGTFTSWDVRASRRYDSIYRSGEAGGAHDVASATIRSAPAEHTDISLRGWYFRSRDLLHPDPESQVTGSERTRATGSAGVSFWRAEAGYQVDVVSYDSPGLDDGRSQAWNAVVFPLRSAQSRILIGWRREEWTLGGRTNLAASVATLGARRNHTPFLSSELELGVARVADDARGPARNEFAMVAGLSGFGHALGLPFDARARVRHDVTTTGLAEAWKAMAGVRLSVRWERTLYANGGVFREPTRRDFVAIEARDTLRAGSVVALEGSYRRDRARVSPADQLKTWRASATASRDLRTWLTGRVRYSMAHQVGEGSIILSDFDRRRLEFSLSAVYR